MAKLKIGNKNIAKKMLGTKEILKEVFNGSVIYEKVVGGNYITFSSPNSFTVAKNSNGSNDGTLEYSTDKTTWNTLSTSAISGVLSNGTYYLYVRGSNNHSLKGKDLGYASYPFFTLVGSQISCSGNIENLLDYQTVELGNHPEMGSSAFEYLFLKCSNLVSGPELPATTLKYNCYHSMFEGCTSLTTIPELPAITLANRCYSSMFSGCKSLYISDTQTTNAPYAWTLPTSGTFTTTQNQPSMFYNCPGTRASNDMAGEAGKSYTYYTQNQPVGD